LFDSRGGGELDGEVSIPSPDSEDCPDLVEVGTFLVDEVEDLNGVRLFSSRGAFVLWEV